MIESAYAGHAKTAQHNGQSIRLLLSRIDCNSLSGINLRARVVHSLIFISLVTSFAGLQVIPTRYAVFSDETLSHSEHGWPFFAATLRYDADKMLDFESITWDTNGAKVNLLVFVSIVALVLSTICLRPNGLAKITINDCMLIMIAAGLVSFLYVYQEQIFAGDDLGGIFTNIELDFTVNNFPEPEVEDRYARIMSGFFNGNFPSWAHPLYFFLLTASVSSIFLIVKSFFERHFRNAR